MLVGCVGSNEPKTARSSVSVLLSFDYFVSCFCASLATVLVSQATGVLGKKKFDLYGVDWCRSADLFPNMHSKTAQKNFAF